MRRKNQLCIALDSNEAIGIANILPVSFVHPFVSFLFEAKSPQFVGLNVKNGKTPSRIAV